MENIYEAVRRALVDALVPEIKQMQTQLAVLTDRVDALGSRLDREDSRLDRVDGRLERMDARLGNVEQPLASLNAKLDAAPDVCERLARLESRSR